MNQTDRTNLGDRERTGALWVAVVVELGSRSDIERQLRRHCQRLSEAFKVDSLDYGDD